MRRAALAERNAETAATALERIKAIRSGVSSQSAFLDGSDVLSPCQRIDAPVGTVEKENERGGGMSSDDDSPAHPVRRKKNRLVRKSQLEVESEEDALPTSLLEAAHLDSVRLAKGSPAAGQAIGALELRTNTGVSIVGIERDSERIVNPGPGETLHEGDLLLLLGEDSQLPKAKAELASTQAD